VNFREIAESARPHLRELVSGFGETAHLGMVPFEDPRSVVYLDRVDSARPVRVVTVLGSKAPSYSSAMGKAIVAHNPEFESIVLSGPLETVTPRTIVDPGELRKDFERTRARGYSIAHGEYIGDMIGIAAPVHDRAGPVTLGIGVWASAEVMTGEFIDRLAPALLAAALRISRELGFLGTHG
jgi:DNA-binding IclR family transcriptional regulator